MRTMVDFPRTVGATRLGSEESAGKSPVAAEQSLKGSDAIGQGKVAWIELVRVEIGQLAI